MYPQLAKTWSPGKVVFPAFLQPKLNGIRGLYQTGNFQSREQILWRPAVLSHLRQELHALQAAIGNRILDGEFYVHGWKLNRINSAVAVKSSEPTADTPSVCFHVFDCVDPSFGFAQSFSERFLPIYNILQETCDRFPHILPVPTSYVYLEEEVHYHFQQYVSAGYEGVMLRPNGPYTPGRHLSRRTGTLTEKRSTHLWKHKAWEDAEFVCVGTTPGQGKAAIGIGALVCQTVEGKTFEIGTGYDDSERVEYAANPPIGRLIKARFAEYTAYGVPFHARFLAVL